MQPIELQELTSQFKRCVRCGVGIYNTFGNCTNCPAQETDDQADECFYTDEQDDKDEQDRQEFIDLDQTLTE